MTKRTVVAAHEQKSIWLWWIAVNILGWSAGGLAAAWSGIALGYDQIVHGAIIGVGQWLILRHFFPGSGWWIVVTALYWNLASVAWRILSLFIGLDRTLDLVAQAPSLEGPIVAGCILGGVQWLFLRRFVPRAGWWILGSIMGLTLGRLLAAILYVLLPEMSIAESAQSMLRMLVYQLAGFIVLGAMYGAITGTTLINLLHQPLRNAESHADPT